MSTKMVVAVVGDVANIETLRYRARFAVGDVYAPRSTKAGRSKVRIVRIDAERVWLRSESGRATTTTVPVFCSSYQVERVPRQPELVVARARGRAPRGDVATWDVLTVTVRLSATELARVRALAERLGGRTKAEAARHLLEVGLRVCEAWQPT